MERFDCVGPSGGRRKRRKEVVEVTQLIGAICDGGKAVVAVSDRMITGFSYSFEPGMGKGCMLADNAFVLMAGVTETAFAIAWEAYGAVSQKGETAIARIADEVAIAFRRERERQVVSRYLARFGITSLQHWHAVQGKLREDLAQNLSAQIAMHEVRVELLVGGVDSAGGQLYVTSDRMENQSFTRTGYCCVGSGEVHAETTFARYRYDTTFTLNEALYVAYEAKRRAEMDPGVGEETDVFVVDSQMARLLDKETRADLEGLYSGQVDGNPRDTIRTLVDTWKPKLVVPSALGGDWRDYCRRTARHT